MGKVLEGREVQRQGNTQTLRVLGMLLVVLAVPSAWAGPPRTPKEAAVRQPDRWGDVQRALEEGQQRASEISAGLGRVEEQLEQVQKRLAEVDSEVRPVREQLHGLHEALRELREEVRGLYVESSGLKGDIAQVSDKLDGTLDELDKFRLSAGIIAALLVLLQIVAIALLLRGRP